MRKYFFSVTIVDAWNSLLAAFLRCNNVENFKRKLDCLFNDRGYEQAFSFFPLVSHSLWWVVRWVELSTPMVKVVMWNGGGLTWRSQVGANPIPIPHPTNLVLFGHKITLYRFNQRGLILLQGGSNRSRGLSPWPPHFNHWSTPNSQGSNM